MKFIILNRAHHFVSKKCGTKAADGADGHHEHGASAPTDFLDVDNFWQYNVANKINKAVD